MCDGARTSGIYVVTVWPRIEKKKTTSKKEAQNLYPNKYISNQVIVQTKADLKICIRVY